MAKTMHVYYANHGFAKPYITLESILMNALNGDAIAFEFDGKRYVYERTRVDEVRLMGTKVERFIFDEMDGESWLK